MTNKAITHSLSPFILSFLIVTTNSAHAQDESFTQVVNEGVVRDERIGSGVQLVSESGMAEGVTIEKKGAQKVFEGGWASESIVFEGGIQQVEKGGTAIGTYIKAGGLQTIGAGGIAIGSIVGEGGIQHIKGEGLAHDAKVKADGVQRVDVGGIAISTVFESGGIQQALPGSILKDQKN